MQIRFDMVSCFVIRPNAAGTGWEFLQLRRCQDDFLGGTWQTVYGTSEGGEAPAAAALRELREETALVPLELYQLNDVDVFYIAQHDTLWHSIAFCAVVKRQDAPVLIREHDALR